LQLYLLRVSAADIPAEPAEIVLCKDWDLSGWTAQVNASLASNG
jgi:hypothetical protein